MQPLQHCPLSANQNAEVVTVPDAKFPPQLPAANDICRPSLPQDCPLREIKTPAPLKSPMMLQSATALSLGAILLLATGARTAQESQLVLGAPSNPRPAEHGLQSILAALDVHHDPVDAFISLYPEAKDDLAQPRLLHVLGRRAGENPKWGTEGDKLRLRRRGKKFIDLTDHHEFYAGLPERACAGKASRRRPPVSHDHQGSRPPASVPVLTTRRPSGPDTPRPHRAPPPQGFYHQDT